MDEIYYESKQFAEIVKNFIQIKDNRIFDKNNLSIIFGAKRTNKKIIFS